MAQCGYIDSSAHLYQGGGEAEDFIYWKERLVTFQADLWEQLCGPLGRHIQYLEMVDRVANRVYRTSFQTARDAGHWYDAGIGKRWGVPLECWEVT